MTKSQHSNSSALVTNVTPFMTSSAVDMIWRSRDSVNNHSCGSRLPTLSILALFMWQYLLLWQIVITVSVMTWSRQSP